MDENLSILGDFFLGPVEEPAVFKFLALGAPGDLGVSVGLRFAGEFMGDLLPFGLTGDLMGDILPFGLTGDLMGDFLSFGVTGDFGKFLQIITQVTL